MAETQTDKTASKYPRQDLAEAAPSKMHEKFAEFLTSQTGVKVDPKAVQLVTTLRVSFRKSPLYLEDYKGTLEEQKAAQAEEKERAKAAKAKEREDARLQREAEKAEKAKVREAEKAAKEKERQDKLAKKEAEAKAKAEQEAKDKAKADKDAAKGASINKDAAPEPEPAAAGSPF
jgi:ATPase subunit of ABC transporter with duplicated ATPase domains